MLAVARNLVSAIRLVHVMGIFADDPRVRIRWTIVPGSDYADETSEYLAALGMRLTPWDRACATEHALIIATSANGDLHRLRGPLLLLPHGAGFNRVVAADESAPAGLASAQLLHEGRVVPEIVGLEHENQHERLAFHCPDAAARGVVLGDPTRDRMAVGAGLRTVYRRTLGVSGQQALVVLSSTWGPGSLLDAHPDLPVRLAAALPFDDHRIAAIVHPNAAARMGSWEVGRLLSRSQDAGLRLVPPDRWESTVLAADLVIGDHGSVSLYAAAAGVRLLLGAYDAAQIVADSPMAALSARVPHLRPGASLESELRTALAQDVHTPAYEQARDAFGIVGRSLPTTQHVAYRLLGLSRPSKEPDIRAPEPCRREQNRTAHLVIVERSPDHQGTYSVRRFAPHIDPDLLAAYDGSEVCRHLTMAETDLDMYVRDNAEVVFLDPPDNQLESFPDQASSVFAHQAPCATAIATVTRRGHCQIVLRNYGSVDLHTGRTDLDETILPSVLLALISVEGGDVPTAVGRLRTGVPIRVGGIEAVATVS
ncbi:MAG TPA: hypothetical protein VGX23_14630 [Actinocrinis sp.]|nr:hypothetical protein [Actinocrinis sp.]